MAILLFVTNVCVLEKQVDVMSVSKVKKCPQALTKKKVEDNLGCVASILFGGSSVNARPQCMKNKDIHTCWWQDDQELKIEDEEQSRVKQINQGFMIKRIMDELSVASEASRLNTFQELGSLRRGFKYAKGRPNKCACWCNLEEHMVQRALLCINKSNE